MTRRWWQRPARVDGPHLAESQGMPSRGVWWDLTRPEAVPAPAAENAARQAEQLAALEQVLNEPTMIVERGLRVPAFVAHRRFGRGVRHA